ncbi:Transmembrane protein DDB_G0292058 [Linum grandiflorum]
MASTTPSSTLLLLFLSCFIFTSSFLLLLPSSAASPEFSGAEHGSELSASIRLNDDYQGNSTTVVLAEERTRRKDPLNHYTPYTGGFNISSQHYWASVSATSVPFILLAGVWFVVFGLSLILTCLCFCCCGGDSYGYSRLCYALSLFFLILFTVAAIAGCVVLYTGQGKFYGATSDTLDYVVNQADVTAESLKNVSAYLSAAKSVGVESFVLPADTQAKLDTLVAKANSSGTTLSSRTQDNRDNIIDGLKGVRMALIVLAAVMLGLAFLGFLFSILGMTCLVYCLVILGWILVAGTFILCGVFLLLHNVVADTCVAMDDWVQHPTAYTAMDDFIPCVDNATAQETLLQSKQVTFQLTNMVDNVLSNFSNRNFPPLVPPPLNFNQSGPLVPLLCNPFNPDLTDRSCAPGEVDLSNATEAWKEYVCEATESGICTTTGRLTTTLYSQMASAVNVSYGLFRYGPFLVELEDCTFVRSTFTDINASYCPKLRRYTEWIYVGLVIVSAAVMFSLIFWVVYARERRHRVYTKQFITRPHDNKGP